MKKSEIFEDGLKKLIAAKRSQKILDGWFLYQEIKMELREELERSGRDPDSPSAQSEILCGCVARMPLSIPEGSAIAGTQDDAFSPSYALINPAFKVESFAGYCDPLAVYNDIRPSRRISEQRICKVRDYYSKTRYVRNLQKIYGATGDATKEVAFFVEPVTGHVVPDFRPFLKNGIAGASAEASELGGYPKTMRDSLRAASILSLRYAKLASRLTSSRKDPMEKKRLRLITENCARVPEKGAENLHQAIQSFALLWQVLCLEQSPNPYAFSVGNLDRTLMPYLKDLPFDEAAELVRHLLAFFMVGDRCWAISQNIMVAGKDSSGSDATNEMSYIVLEAFRRSNNPQPALSVKLHGKSPEKLYEKMGDFFFSRGHSTPSLFNDDMMFRLLEKKGLDKEDLGDYSIAGCQEPLVMGKENGNTTNSWLNLAKILELTLNDGASLISGKKIGLSWKQLGYKNFKSVCEDMESAYWKQFDYFLSKMVSAANKCVEALGTVAAPFSSAMMGCLESGRDMRDSKNPGTKYFGSGCLVHGLSVLSDSIAAIAELGKSGLASPERLLDALRKDFQGAEDIRGFLLSAPKYGNGCKDADRLAARIAMTVSEKISACKNPAGSAYTPDFSTPTTHLLYGYWVGATPDGRKAREMLGYGIDPRPGVSKGGIQDRMLSSSRLPFDSFSGGYASHLGLAPRDFSTFKGNAEKGRALRDRVISPLFNFDSKSRSASPFYVYFNIDDSSHLRKVMNNPGKYAPSGIYIMRIHGTFVNFLDLSPAIQEDIIERLDPASTAL